MIHKHSRSGDVHWDLMLLYNEALLTWRLESPPKELQDRITEAIKIADHDLKFLSYEGPVNNGTGKVEMAAKGACRIQLVSEKEIEIEFDSAELAGRFKLQSVDGDKWRLLLLA